MRIFLLVTALVLGCVPLAAQVQSPLTYSSPLGFTYTLPPGWTMVKAPAAAPPATPPAERSARTKSKNREADCAQVVFTARHGSPASIIVITELPFACYGQTITAQDLSGFATGAEAGLKQHFDLADPVYGSYKLDAHPMWIERAKGAPIGHPASLYTIEIACGLLKKGAACWMTMAAGASGLRAFENGAVRLDGKPATALVPASAFDKKPS